MAKLIFLNETIAYVVPSDDVIKKYRDFLDRGDRGNQNRESRVNFIMREWLAKFDLTENELCTDVTFSEL